MDTAKLTVLGLRGHIKTYLPPSFGLVDIVIRMQFPPFDSTWTLQYVCASSRAAILTECAYPRHFDGNSLMLFGKMMMSSCDTRRRLTDFAT